MTSKETRLLEWVRDKLKAKYGDVSYKSGKRLKYLGINIIINDDGSIDLDCEDVFTEMLKNYKIQKKSTYPAGRGLFNIREEGVSRSSHYIGTSENKSISGYNRRLEQINKITLLY